MSEDTQRLLNFHALVKPYLLSMATLVTLYTAVELPRSMDACHTLERVWLDDTMHTLYLTLEDTVTALREQYGLSEGPHA